MPPYGTLEGSMAGTNVIPDGNEEIAAEIPLIVEIVARTARWVHPETFRALPVWCPWTARGRPLYEKSWQRRATNTRRDTKQTSEKFEANVDAGKALMAALGTASPKPGNWTVCHIWGYDDDAFMSQSGIVRNPRYYSCVANMVWLPTPLKGFTDALPDMKTMLRSCAFHLFGWACEDESVKAQADAIRNGGVPKGYPPSWPSPDRPGLLPPGTAPFTASIRDEIQKRKAKIRAMLADTTLLNFPRKEVEQVLEFWKVDLDSPIDFRAGTA
jgi:hypothetical protein